MSFEFGDVLLLPFPFTDQTAAKKRPAAVVSNKAYNSARQDVVVAITSQIGRSDVDLVSDWRFAGLRKPPALKPVFSTVEKSLVLKQLGRLNEADRRLLSSLVAKALG